MKNFSRAAASTRKFTTRSLNNNKSKEIGCSALCRVGPREGGENRSLFIFSKKTLDKLFIMYIMYIYTYGRKR